MGTEDFFDEDGKQTRKFSEKEMLGTGFSVGDKIEYFDHPWMRSFGIIVGVVKEIRPGYGPYPSVWREAQDGEEEGFWVGQHPAYLVVDFGPDVVFAYSWKSESGGSKKVPSTTRGFDVTDEGECWKRVV